jgi:hypothetical protein
LVTSLTFGSSLRTLVAHPSLYGWNFDSALLASGGYGNLDETQLHGALDRSPDVAAWSGYYFGSVELDGQNIPILGGTPGDAVAPPLLSGRGLRGGDEVVLGDATLKRLHRHVGDVVELAAGGASERLRIVGTATLPTIGIVHGTHPSVGSGALIAFDKLAGYARNIQQNASYGPNAVFIRFRNGRAVQGAQALNRAFANDDPSRGGVQVLGAQRPAEIVNYRVMGAAPAAMASALVAAATLSLGLALAASVRRRRRDLAMMKVLGFTTRQLKSTVVWQASVIGIVGLIVGIPLGVAAGRALWARFAGQLHVVVRPTVPVAELVLVVVGCLLLVNAVAAWPGRAAGRTPAAAALRAE